VCLCASVKLQHILSFLLSAAGRGCVSSLDVPPSSPLSPCFNLPVTLSPNDEHFLCLSLSSDCESVSKSEYNTDTRRLGFEFDCSWRRTMLPSVNISVKYLASFVP